MGNLCIITFYHFAALDNYEDMRAELSQFCNQKNLKGTILLAEEGINASIAGDKSDVYALLDFLGLDDRLKEIEWKESEAEFEPFQEMKVRLKREVVALGDGDLENTTHNDIGEYVLPEDWDQFIRREDVKTIDVRNLYETKIGSFVNALDPETLNFREFRDWVQRWVQDNNIQSEQKIAMYCTGGVRCEKSTAYMKKLGFRNVYHLKGGILNYFIKTKNLGNGWQGACFVFDDRVAVDENMNAVQLGCVSCGSSVTTDDLKNVPRGRVLCSGCQIV